MSGYFIKKISTALSVALLVTLIFSCDRKEPEHTTTPPETIEKDTFGIVDAFPKLSFKRPVDFQFSPDGTNRVFVVEQEGIISVFSNDSTVETKKIFLDIHSKVQSAENEQGLLGLAFHPAFASNGYFYVNYTATNPERTVISRFKISGDADAADEDSEYPLLTYAQPFSNHNGGQLSFGSDGFLYIAAGDGGSGGDPFGNGQNKKALLGKILRINVDKTSNDLHYSIPADNPFAGNKDGYREEVYAYGMRNPWRFSFDRQTNKLWVADVGQNTYEEIDIIEKGDNCGWNAMEGKHCFSPTSGCDMTGLKLPVFEYDHSIGSSITGGFVYRGESIKGIQGRYIFADYVSGKMWSLNTTDPGNVSAKLIMTVDFGISSFGIDMKNEIFVCGFDGKIHKLNKPPA